MITDYNVEMTKTTSSRLAKKRVVPVSRVGRLKFAEPTILSLPIQPITPEDKYKNKLNYGRVSAGCRNSHPDFDEDLGNTCTNHNVMGSVCTVGVDQQNFKLG